MFVVSVTRPPVIRESLTTTSLTPGLELSIVIPSEQTGSDFSNALLYATTVKKYVPSEVTVWLPKVLYVSTIWNGNMFSVKSSEWSCICVLWYGYIICPLFLQFWNCSDSVVFWNCSDSVVFWNCSDSVVSFAFHFTTEICRKLIKVFYDVIHLSWYLYNIRYKYTSISLNSYIVHFSYFKTKWITWIHSTLHVYLLLCQLCLSRCLCFSLALFSHF